MKNIAVSNEMDDLSLWKLSVKGHSKALEIIYQRYYLLLLNYGLKCNFDRELIKDCVQDVFINIYNNSQISVTSVSVPSYLLRALKNNITYKLLSQKSTDSLEELAFNIPVNDDLLEQIFPKNDEDLRLANKLLDAISQLSSNQKMILYLRYVKDLSYKDIAETMHVNVQSAMNLSNRALNKLRKIMGNDCNLVEVWQLVFLKLAFYYSLDA